MAEIRYLKHKNIDFEQWDNAISQSTNGLVYGYSWVLNSLANEQWDALVLGNYKAVFPLVYKSKFGIKYLYQPYFCQQLGLFSKIEITEQLLKAFLNKIPSKFKFWHFHLNYANASFNIPYQTKQRTTLQIDLQQSYTTIYDQYNADAKKNLAKAQITGYEVRKNLDIELVSHTFFEQYGRHYPKVDKLIKQINTCAKKAIQLGKGFTLGIYGKNSELWCAGFFFNANSILHYAMAAPTAEGKKYGATHILIDEVLKAYSGKNYVFDFEGSDIPTVAYFYAKFGSKPQHYLEIKNNKLPWWCRWLKV